MAVALSALCCDTVCVFTSAQVLSLGAWPVGNAGVPFTPPHELEVPRGVVVCVRGNDARTVRHTVQVPMSVFADFYARRSTGRKLQWMFKISKVSMRTDGRGRDGFMVTLPQAELATTLGKRAYVFVVSTFQLAVLLLFNNVTVVRFLFRVCAPMVLDTPLWRTGLQISFEEIVAATQLPVSEVCG